MQNPIYRAQKSAHATMHRLLAHLTSHTFSEMYLHEWMNVCVRFDFIYFRANCILTRAFTKFYGSNWKLWLFPNSGECMPVCMWSTLNANLLVASNQAFISLFTLAQTIAIVLFYRWWYLPVFFPFTAAIKLSFTCFWHEEHAQLDRGKKYLNFPNVNYKSVWWTYGNFSAINNLANFIWYIQIEKWILENENNYYLGQWSLGNHHQHFWWIYSYERCGSTN